MPAEPLDSNQLSELAIWGITMILILIDLAYAGLRAWTKRPEAENFFEYLVSRGTIIVLVALARIVETLLPNVPLVYLTCLFYSAVSVAHIIGNARKDGAPIPTALTSALESLKATAGGADAGAKSEPGVAEKGDTP